MNIKVFLNEEEQEFEVEFANGESHSVLQTETLTILDDHIIISNIDGSYKKFNLAGELHATNEPAVYYANMEAKQYWFKDILYAEYQYDVLVSGLMEKKDHLFPHLYEELMDHLVSSKSPILEELLEDLQTREDAEVLKDWLF